MVRTRGIKKSEKKPREKIRVFWRIATTRVYGATVSMPPMIILWSELDGFKRSLKILEIENFLGSG